VCLFTYWNKFRYAWRGLSYVFRRERSFRLELAVALLAVLMGWRLNFSLQAWALLALTCAVVLAAEVVNTALERLLDLVEPRLSLHIAFLKDLLAAAVLLLALGSLVVGWLLVVEHL